MFLPVVLIALVLAICLVIARVTGGRARCAGRLSPEAAAAAVARHPAARSRRARSGRAAPLGPDDDPDFLRLLDQRIRGIRDPGE